MGSGYDQRPITEVGQHSSEFKCNKMGHELADTQNKSENAKILLVRRHH